MMAKGDRTMAQHSVTNRIPAFLSEVRNHLETGIIPFWLRHAADPEFGGYRTNFNGHGEPLDMPEKYLNTQVRLLWWFSRLLRTYPNRTEFRKMTEIGIDFIVRHFWDQKHGGWFWKVKRDGTRSDAGKVVYGQSFAIYAFAEYYRATNDPKGLEYATRTFDLLQKYAADTLRGGYYENLEEDWTIAPGGVCAGDRKGLDTHMHLMEAFTTLYAASGQEIHHRKLVEVMDLITRRMVDPETGCGRNQFDPDFNPIPAIAIRRTWNAERAGDAPATPTDTTSYGHNVELAWLMLDALRTAEIPVEPYHDTIRRLLEHAVEHGVDREFGGIYRDGTSRGGPLIRDKEFWQHSEVLVGFLDGYERFGEEKYLDAFERVWHFVLRHMIVKGVGEWRVLVDRQGVPIDSDTGNEWKVAYHTGRAMIECVARLERLREMPENTTKGDRP
jgi:mannobiose 2-epimerase